MQSISIKIITKQNQQNRYLQKTGNLFEALNLFKEYLDQIAEKNIEKIHIWLNDTLILNFGPLYLVPKNISFEQEKEDYADTCEIYNQYRK